jgi:hypothetical protein
MLLPEAIAGVASVAGTTNIGADNTANATTRFNQGFSLDLTSTLSRKVRDLLPNTHERTRLDSARHYTRSPASLSTARIRTLH